MQRAFGGGATAASFGRTLQVNYCLLPIYGGARTGTLCFAGYTPLRSVPIRQSHRPTFNPHTQAAAYEVVEAVSKNSLSSSLVWFIHDRQIVMQMVDDLAELVRMNSADEKSEAALERVDSLSDYLLSGERAEEAGMWLVAAKAVIVLVCDSCRYSAALLSDLQEARGYDILRYMVRYSSPTKRPDLLSRVAHLVGKYVIYFAYIVLVRHHAGRRDDNSKIPCSLVRRCWN